VITSAPARVMNPTSRFSQWINVGQKCQHDYNFKIPSCVEENYGYILLESRQKKNSLTFIGKIARIIEWSYLLGCKIKTSVLVHVDKFSKEFVNIYILIYYNIIKVIWFE